jgi:hypothetical protein
MWSTPQETEDSAGYADTVTDSAFAILGAVIVAVIFGIARLLWS